MVKTFVFKLYRSRRNKKLHRQINAAGLIYNHCIALHKRYYRLFGKSLNMYQLQKHLTKLKKVAKFSYLKEIDSQAVQDITQRIDRAYKLFYRNLEHGIRTAPPSFKKVARYKSYTLKQAGWKLDEDTNTLFVGKQKYRYSKSREIQGTVKTVTIKRDFLGDIYVYFVCEVQENEVLARLGKIIGFDFGYKTFLTAPEKKDNVVSPRFFKKNANKIKRANQILSRKKKGSNNRKRAKLALARLHKRTTNQRKAFHWEQAYKS